MYLKKAISSWESRVTELDEQNIVLFGLLEAELNQKRMWLSSLSDGSSEVKLDYVEDSSGDQEPDIGQLTVRLTSLNASLDVFLKSGSHATTKNNDDHPKIESLQNQVTTLEEELRECLDALQMHVSTEVSERATEIAAAALRQVCVHRSIIAGSIAMLLGLIQNSQRYSVICSWPSSKLMKCGLR